MKGYPAGWAERADALDRGAPAGDWHDAADLEARKKLSYWMQAAERARKPHWVVEYEGGVPVAMRWYDPSATRTTDAQVDDNQGGRA